MARALSPTTWLSDPCCFFTLSDGNWYSINNNNDNKMGPGGGASTLMWHVDSEAVLEVLHKNRQSTFLFRSSPSSEAQVFGTAQAGRRAHYYPAPVCIAGCHFSLESRCHISLEWYSSPDHLTRLGTWQTCNWDGSLELGVFANSHVVPVKDATTARPAAMQTTGVGQFVEG